MNDSTPELPLVVVLGMHRSGTSAVAGALVRLGLHAGSDEEMLAAAADNPRGYFERRDTVEVNDRLLAARATAALGDRLRVHAGGEAESVADFGWLLGGWAPCEDVDMASADASAIAASLAALRAGAGDAAGLLLKDPRLCRTLPAWRSRIAAQCVVVVMVRSPAAVIASLARRDGMPAALARFLWTRYTTGALDVSEGLPRMLLDYDRMLAEPDAALSKVCRFLADNDIRMDPEPGRLATAHEFLNPELRHARPVATADDESGALYRKLLAGEPGIALRAGSEHADAGTHELELCQALHLILSRRLTEARLRGERLALALERLENHVVSGTVVRALRRLKRDPGFGAP